MILLAMLLQAATPAPACVNPDDLPAAAARGRCSGMVLAGSGRWREAAGAFEGAAKQVNSAKAADLWAQAGNAWLAAGDPARAGAALDAALVWSEGRSEFDKGELRLDRARAAVAAGDLDAGRTVLDQALTAVPGDPLAWLLSATLARRMGQPARAAKDIAEALKRAPDDAAVQLEAGNIAALAGDTERARSAGATRRGYSRTATRGEPRGRHWRNSETTVIWTNAGGFFVGAPADPSDASFRWHDGGSKRSACAISTP